MASGILGQAALAQGVDTTVYTVPAGMVGSFTVSLCNLAGAPVGIRLALATSATPASQEWIEYNATIAGQGVLERTGLIAEAGRRVVAWASAGTVAVSVYGFEEA